MSKTLLRGLDLIETVGLHGPMTISEIARATGTEMSAVSRTVTACEPGGWLVRAAGKVNVGPRCALLGLTSPASAAIRRAEPLVNAIAGAIRVSTSASALVGHETMVLSSSSGAGSDPAIADGVPSRTPVHLMADGRAIAAQLSPETLTKVLPPEPYPVGPQSDANLQVGSAIAHFLDAAGPGGLTATTSITTRAQLNLAVEAVVAEGFSRDSGQIHPRVYCISRPWPAAGLPAAITCIGSRDEILQRQAAIEACLAAATEPGATAQDVVQAAATASTVV